MTVHLFLRVLSILFVSAIPFVAVATIVPSYQYAWSNQGGWINFAPTQAGVVVDSYGLSGYAWAQNTGWISFQTTESGVTNDGRGNLGGFAWSEGEGWLSFTGVSIDATGRFRGVATGAHSSLTFDCGYCDVRTNWRPSTQGSSGGASGYRPVPPVIEIPEPNTPPPNVVLPPSSTNTSVPPRIPEQQPEISVPSVPQEIPSIVDLNLNPDTPLVLEIPDEPIPSEDSERTISFVMLGGILLGVSLALFFLWFLFFRRRR